MSERITVFASPASTNRESLCADNTGNVGTAPPVEGLESAWSAAARWRAMVGGGGWSRRERKKALTGACFAVYVQHVELL